MSGGADPRDSGSALRNARRGLPLLLALLASSGVSAEDVAVRIRDDGRVDIRATSAPLRAVLDKLGQTGMKVTYQGPPPRRMVTLEVYASSQAQAVLDVLEGLGVDYAVTLSLTGTRILSLVVAEKARPAGGRADPEEVEPQSPADPTEPDESAAAPLPGSTEPADESEAGGNANAGEGFPLLTGDYVPGGRATGQVTAWGMPPFVLPDPPDVEAPVQASTDALSEPPEIPRTPAIAPVTESPDP